MAEYIDRQEAKEWIADWLIEDKSWHPYSKGKNIPTVEVFDILSRIPTADVQPVKHGRWVRDAAYVDETTGEPCLAWFCNQCGEPQMVGTNFCPNCGADMRGE